MNFFYLFLLIGLVSNIRVEALVCVSGSIPSNIISPLYNGTCPSASNNRCAKAVGSYAGRSTVAYFCTDSYTCASSPSYLQIGSVYMSVSKLYCCSLSYCNSSEKVKYNSVLVMASLFLSYYFLRK